MDADSLDQAKLASGLEVRTSCCHRLVPTDCLNAVCQHGVHELRDPVTGESQTRDDIPCILYAPEPALTYHHPPCTARRTYLEALAEAEEIGTPRQDEEREMEEE